MDYSKLPSVNASLNATTVILLAFGYFFIRRRAIFAHKVCMLSACATSVLFLISYLTYHAHHHVTRYQGTGLLRPAYFFILISHTVLAVVIVPMVWMTLGRALKNNFEKHAVIARRTLPLWLYVSATGVIVYWMLYHLNS